MERSDDGGTPFESLNHYSKGAVVSFLHRYLADIELLDDRPGYRRFRVAPQPGPGITWAEAIHDSPYGRIESSPRVDAGELTLTVVVPPATRRSSCSRTGRSTRWRPADMPSARTGLAADLRAGRR